MKRAWTVSIFIILLSLTVSCRINVPITEMTRARATITEAYSVKADKYAPELIQEAEKSLYSSHDFCIKDDISDAKKAAVKSFELATDAINKSLPLLAGDTLSQAKSTYGEAEKLYAEKYAAEEFTKAGTLITESGTLFDGKDFRASYKSAAGAITEAESAKEKSLQQIPVLKEAMENLAKERNELMTSPSKDSGIDDLNKAGESLTRASDALAAMELKKVDEENTAASQYIAQAKSKITKMTAKDRITVIRQEIQTLKAERGTDFAGEDIVVAESSLNEAESLLEQDRSPDSLVKMKDAEDALSRARSKTGKGIATEKIQSAESLLMATKSKDTAGAHAQELDKASLLIGEGKQLLSEDNFAASISKADEAESIINALHIGDEIDLSKTSDYSLGDGDLKGVYTVQYNKRRPDCLWRIAHKVYKNARLWPLIYVANKNIIRDPDLIFPGQRFQIPTIPKMKDMHQGDKDPDSVQSIDKSAGSPEEMKKEPDKGVETDTLKNQ